MPTYLLDLQWLPEQNEFGYEHIYGHAFGYRLGLEAGPSGRWRAALLNQVFVGKTESIEQAKAAAMLTAAHALLLEALHTEEPRS